MLIIGITARLPDAIYITHSCYSKGYTIPQSCSLLPCYHCYPIDLSCRLLLLSHSTPLCCCEPQPDTYVCISTVPSHSVEEVYVHLVSALNTPPAIFSDRPRYQLSPCLRLLYNLDQHCHPVPHATLAMILSIPSSLRRRVGATVSA